MGIALTQDDVLAIAGYLDAMNGLVCNIYASSDPNSEDFKPLWNQVRVMYMLLGKKLKA